MTLDITQVIFASTIDTFKNIPTSSSVISVPSQSYTSAQLRTFTTTVELLNENAITLILQNYSFDSSRYYVGSHVVLFSTESVTTNFQIITQCSISGTTLTATTYVLNVDVSSHTVPAFDVTIGVRRFTTPFS